MAVGKMAFLTGVSGGGKTHLANQLATEGCAVIPGDHVAHLCALRLCPYLHPRAAWDLRLWEFVLNHCDVRSAMRRTLLDVYNIMPAAASGNETVWRRIEAGKPIVAEALLFGMAGFRKAFSEAMRDAGWPGEGDGIFHLDLAPGNVSELYRGRIEKGERPHDKPVSEATVLEWKRDLERRLVGTGATGCPDRESVASAIRAFFQIPHQA
jgi:hypothetical protein